MKESKAAPRQLQNWCGAHRAPPEWQESNFGAQCLGAVFTLQGTQCGWQWRQHLDTPGARDDTQLQRGPGSLTKKLFGRSPAAWPRVRADPSRSLRMGVLAPSLTSLLQSSNPQRHLSRARHSLADKCSETAHCGRNPSTRLSPGPWLKALPRLTPNDPPALYPSPLLGRRLAALVTVPQSHAAFAQGGCSACNAFLLLLC